jgi:hypothetical protein
MSALAARSPTAPQETQWRKLVENSPDGSASGRPPT